MRFPQIGDREPLLIYPRGFRLQSGTLDFMDMISYWSSIVPDVLSMLYRFRDIAFEMSNVAIFGCTSRVLLPTEGFPWDDLRKILHGGQWIVRLQRGMEKYRKF